jgi:ferredoxin-NADP reductase
MHFIDNLLNKYTMYRVVLYGLTLISAGAFVLSFFKVLAYSPVEMTVSLAVLLVTCVIVNWIFAKIFKIPANVESVFITAFILFLVLVPTARVADVKWLVVTAAIAMAAKYILVFRKQHVFNPAAIGLVIAGVLGSDLSFWWVGAPALFSLVAVVGFLVVRKIHRFTIVIPFLIVSLGILVVQGLVGGGQMMDLMKQYTLSWPLVFFATIMLTEPLTAPARRHLQIAYGVVVGALFSLQFHVGPVYSSPELALVLGNIFSFVISPKQRMVLVFKEKIELATNMFEFIFTAPRHLKFLPGQYAEWTLFHQNPDTRGNRRYFTIASAPESRDVAIGVRLSDPSSSFKKQLASLKIGDTIMTSSAAGDFVLPKNTTKKLVFIAGGIGVTPFRSMVQHLLDTKEKRDIVTLYSVRTLADIAYKEMFETAKAQLGMRTEYLVTDKTCVPPGWNTPTGYICEPTIKQLVPDFAERTFYISGPFMMVEAAQKELRKMGVKRSQIMTDFFPGFAG